MNSKQRSIAERMKGRKHGDEDESPQNNNQEQSTPRLSDEEYKAQLREKYGNIVSKIGGIDDKFRELEERSRYEDVDDELEAYTHNKRKPSKATLRDIVNYNKTHRTVRIKDAKDDSLLLGYTETPDADGKLKPKVLSPQTPDASAFSMSQLTDETPKKRKVKLADSEALADAVEVNPNALSKAWTGEAGFKSGMIAIIDNWIQSHESAGENKKIKNKDLSAGVHEIMDDLYRIDSDSFKRHWPKIVKHWNKHFASIFKFELSQCKSLPAMRAGKVVNLGIKRIRGKNSREEMQRAISELAKSQMQAANDIKAIKEKPKKPAQIKSGPYHMPASTAKEAAHYSYDMNDVIRIIEDGLGIRISKVGREEIEAIIKRAINETTGSKAHGVERIHKVIEQIEDYINERSKAATTFAFTGADREQLISILRREFIGVPDIKPQSKKKKKQSKKMLGRIKALRNFMI